MKRVLVCDDDKEILEILNIILTSAGWEVFTSENVVEIIDKVANYNPSVIVMDNWIPDLGGIFATQQIKSHPVFHSIPVVYSTANDNITDLAKKAGADLFIGKPFNLEDFESIMEQAYLLNCH
ncbi:response regulator [Pedobacter sp. P351]|uniref:response regulator n=1 Tax=Pedobacter superstes TaxID=3133441 RepID=UPI0030B27E35